MASADRTLVVGELERRQDLQTLLVEQLPGCRRETISALRRTARLRALDRGDLIYPQGEPVPLTLILRGYGVARRTMLNGQQFMSGVAGPGYLFGYSGIAAARSSVEVLALTACDVAQWPGAEIRALAVVDPELALAAIDSMGNSLHETLEGIEGFLHQDARRRVLRVLARHRVLFFEEPIVLTRSHLPGLVGTSREMTARVLRQLEREGTVERYGRTGLRLLRPDRLDEQSA
jgi:CRP-like cAMP-binding protein